MLRIFVDVAPGTPRAGIDKQFVRCDELWWHYLSSPKACAPRICTNPAKVGRLIATSACSRNAGLALKAIPRPEALIMSMSFAHRQLQRSVPFPDPSPLQTPAEILLLPCGLRLCLSRDQLGGRLQSLKYLPGHNPNPARALVVLVPG